MLKPYGSIARRALAVLVCGLAGLALLATSTTSFAQGQDLNRNLFNVWHNRNAQSPAECFSVMSIWGQPAYPRTGYPTANWFLIHGSVTWAQAWARVEQSLTQMAARRSGCGFGGSRQRHAAAVGVANQIINDIRRDREQAGGQAVARGGGGRSGGPIPADGAQAAGEEPGVPHDGPLSGDVGADFRPGQLSAGAVERVQPRTDVVWTSTYGDIHWSEGWYGNSNKTLPSKSLSREEDGTYVMRGTWGRRNDPDNKGGFEFLFSGPCRFTGEWWYASSPDNRTGWTGSCK